MITRHILSATAAVLLVTHTLPAQTPAPATPAAGTTTASPTTTPKKLSMNEGKALIDMLEAMQFHIRMNEVGKYKNKDDKEFTAAAQKAHKEMTELFTPLVTVAMNNQLKNIPTGVSRGDKSDIEKLGKAKADEWKQEYYELLAKNGKKNARSVENSLKTITDPELKDLGGKVLALVNTQATEADTKAKELKKAK